MLLILGLLLLALLLLPVLSQDNNIESVTAKLGLPETLRLFSGMGIITVASHQKVSL